MPGNPVLETDVRISTDDRYGPDSKHMRIETIHGYVCFFTGDTAILLAPQITDLEVYPDYRGMGYGEALFLMAARYLTVSPDPEARIGFKEGGLGVGLDMSGGFWEHMAQKYRGADLRDGYDGEWTFGSWGFSAEDLPLNQTEQG
jgi:GNAT superfamily N-acetyltransferase